MAHLYSDSHGATLGGSTPTLSAHLPSDALSCSTGDHIVRPRQYARPLCGWGEGFNFRLAHLYSDSHGARLGGYTFTLTRLALNGCREVSHFGSRCKMESSNRSHFPFVLLYTRRHAAQFSNWNFLVLPNRRCAPRCDNQYAFGDSVGLICAKV